MEELYFKYEGQLWKLYGEDKNLLTGIPLNEVGLHIEGESSPQEKAAQGQKILITFGKFAGKEVRETPKWYRDWLLENFNWNQFNQKLKDEILRLKNIGI